MLTTTIVGRLYCRLPLDQGIGCGVHIDADFLLTPDRDSLDLNQGTKAKWNQDLLSLAGVLMQQYYATVLKKLCTADGELALAHTDALYCCIYVPFCYCPVPR